VLYRVIFHDGSILHVEADDAITDERSVALVRYVIPFVWSVYTVTVRRFDRRTVTSVVTVD